VNTKIISYIWTLVRVRWNPWRYRC